MRLGRHDLTYCSNIHVGEAWRDVFTALQDSLPPIRQQLQHSGPFAIGLRLSAAAALTLEQPSVLTQFRAFLESGDHYVPTINGFPFGAFHGTRVKERVYEPDWRSPERVEYSNRLARILAALRMSDTQQPVSISTVPGAFRQAAQTRDDAVAIARGMLRHAAYLKRLRDDTGVHVVLAIEPEPACFIETVNEAIAFFEEHLRSPELLRAAFENDQLTADDVASHVGVCLDTCHMAVEFEDPEVAIASVRDAGIRIAKVQLSSALRVPTASAVPPQALLAAFAEDTYLHQVVVSDGDQLRRYTDLPDALASQLEASAHGEWRVHFHVPLFLDEMSGFTTTQSYISRVLNVLRDQNVSTCLEVETYTWDVLPPEYRTTDVRTAIARELTWVRGQLN
jgi:sugar phosphate isomerase/epimerase